MFICKKNKQTKRTLVIIVKFNLSFFYFVRYGQIRHPVLHGNKVLTTPFFLFWTQTERGAKVDHLCPLATVVTKRGGGLWHHLSATHNRVLRSIYKQSSHHSHLDLCDVPVIAKWNTSQRIHTLARATLSTTSATTSPPYNPFVNNIRG